MMPIIVVLAALLTGSAWCSLLCYFGPLDSLAAGNAGVRPAPVWLQVALRHGRLGVLVAGSLAALLFRKAGLDTPTALAAAAAFAAASLLCMTLVSRRYRIMAHCAALCPLGAAVAALGKVSPWRMRVDATRCDNCRACETVCKYAAINAESRKAGKTLARCSLCRDCVAVCANKAVFLHCPGLAGDTAQTVFVGILVTLHAVFLATAMV